jgi:hypothetical protein
VLRLLYVERLDGEITVESPHRGNPSSWPQHSCQPGIKCHRLFKKLLLGLLRTLHVILRVFNVDVTRGNHDLPKTSVGDAATVDLECLIALCPRPRKQV